MKWQNDYVRRWKRVSSVSSILRRHFYTKNKQATPYGLFRITSWQVGSSRDLPQSQCPPTWTSTCSFYEVRGNDGSQGSYLKSCHVRQRISANYLKWHHLCARGENKMEGPRWRAQDGVGVVSTPTFCPQHLYRQYNLCMPIFREDPRARYREGMCIPAPQQQ